MTARDGFMTDAEMGQHFPNKKPGWTLVTLVELGQEFMWKREPDGWYRLDGEPLTPRT